MDGACFLSVLGFLTGILFGWFADPSAESGILFVMTAFIILRARLSSLRLEQEIAPPPAFEPTGEAA